MHFILQPGIEEIESFNLKGEVNLDKEEKNVSFDISLNFFAIFHTVFNCNELLLFKSFCQSF